MEGRRSQPTGPDPAPHAVLVVGLPRGGTTWVGRSLGHTPGAVYVHEPDGTHDPWGYVAKRDLLYHPILDDDAPVRYEQLWRGAFAGGAPSRTLRDRVARRAYAGVRPEAKTAARRGDRVTPRLRIVARAAQPLVGRDDCSHVVVKSVNAAFAVEWIAARFPVDVAVVLRHPLDVIASWRDFGWSPPGGELLTAISRLARERWDVEPVAGDADALPRAAFLAACMTASFEDALATHPAWVRIQHEVVCLDPQQHLRSAAEALHLGWGEAAAGFVSASDRPGSGYATQRVAAEQIDRWRTRLEPDQVRQAVEVLARFPQPALTARVDLDAILGGPQPGADDSTT